MILITGASKGIGKYLMEKLQKSDHLVHGTYHTSLPDKKNISFLTKVDITNQSEVKSWIDLKTEGEENIVLINCAGTNYNSFAHKTEMDKW